MVNSTSSLSPQRRRLLQTVTASYTNVTIIIIISSLTSLSTINTAISAAPSLVNGTFIPNTPSTIQLFILEPVTISGDPAFVGFRGQKYQVHGIAGEVYNLISDKAVQINSRFTFLEGPRSCPIMPSTKRPSSTCWSHPGTYLEEIGIQTISGQQIYIHSGDAMTGFNTIQLNGQQLNIISSSSSSSSTTTEPSQEHARNKSILTIMSSHEVSIIVPPFAIVLENVDGFINLRSVAVTHSSRLRSHGLLGQTHHLPKKNKQKSSVKGYIKEIEGSVEDYRIEEDSVFGVGFMYNQFTLITAGN